MSKRRRPHLRGQGSLVRSQFINKGEDTTTPPPVIATQWGPVTEAARLQAVANMRDFPEVKARVIALIGEERVRRNYPEAFDDNAG